MFFFTHVVTAIGVWEKQMRSTVACVEKNGFYYRFTSICCIKKWILIIKTVPFSFGMNREQFFVLRFYFFSLSIFSICAFRLLLVSFKASIWVCCS